MKTLIIYDSFFGNTEQIAKAISEAIGSASEVEIRKVSEVKPEQLEGINLLVVGSPTRAFRPSPAINSFLKSILANSLHNVKAVAFDTGISMKDTKSGFLRFMMNIFGYAAKPISEKLRRKGAEIAVSPEGFFVKDTKGPLKEGELERAKKWIMQIKGK